MSQRARLIRVVLEELEDRLPVVGLAELAKVDVRGGVASEGVGKGTHREL